MKISIRVLVDGAKEFAIDQQIDPLELAEFHYPDPPMSNDPLAVVQWQEQLAKHHHFRDHLAASLGFALAKVLTTDPRERRFAGPK